MESQELLDTGGEAVGGGGVARLRGQVQVVVLHDQEAADFDDLLLDQDERDRHQRVVVDQMKSWVVEEHPIVSEGQADGEWGFKEVLRPVVGVVEGVAHAGLWVGQVLHPQPPQLLSTCSQLKLLTSLQFHSFWAQQTVKKIFGDLW